jgi:hypothetical protein
MRQIMSWLYTEWCGYAVKAKAICNMTKNLQYSHILCEGCVPEDHT